MIRRETDVFIGLTIAGLIMVILISVIVSSLNVQNENNNYQINDPNRPNVDLSEKSLDFGKVDSKEIKKGAIEIRNKGKNDLIISNPSTSCGCTSVSFDIGGQKSPVFSMHNNQRWQGTINPNQKAVMEITYNPNFHPAKGAIKRSIHITTNDPRNKDLEFNIFAEVE